MSAESITGANNLDQVLQERDHWMFLATHDEMTGVYNRRGLFMTAKENNFRFCYVVDIDGLKAINDTQGHAVGDDYIKKVVAELKRFAATGGGIVARTGGDEFVILTNQLVAGFHNEHFSHGWVALEGYESLDYAINRADARMYTRKTARKNAR